MQVCFCVCRWKMSVRLRKCSTWLITSAPRSWGRPRAAARRTTAASRCCAASSQETPWVHLSGCLPVVLSVTNRITEYVCQCFCPAPQVSGFMEHLIQKWNLCPRPSFRVLVFGDYAVLLDLDGGVPPTCASGLVDKIWDVLPHLCSAIGWAACFLFLFWTGLICRIQLDCQRMSQSGIIPETTAVCHALLFLLLRSDLQF